MYGVLRFNCLSDFRVVTLIPSPSGRGVMKDSLLFVVVCIIIGSTTLVLAKNGDIHMDKSLLVFLVSYFQYLANIQYDPHRQHSFLTVLTEEEAHWNTSVTFWPAIVFPTKDQTLTPANPKDYVNHLAAIPLFQKRKRDVHTEEQILERLDELITAFQKNGSKIAAIVLYTYRIPCENCTQRIVDYFAHRWQVCRNINITVVYTKGSPFDDVSRTEKKLHRNGIALHQIDQSEFKFPSNTCTAEGNAAILDFESFVEEESQCRMELNGHDEEEEEIDSHNVEKDHTSDGRYKMETRRKRRRRREMSGRRRSGRVLIGVKNHTWQMCDRSL